MRYVLALPTMCREPSPDGDTYGSRWSRAKRETTGTTNAPDFPTAAAVAEEFTPLGI
ncbi:MAG: hypothetical protein QOF63_3289 [Thermoanaerobaculia bacterium]|jgi:hypothetical protein|nr:hypothetical protein [Thermoanaerobaculia bacterium]MEA2415729.1 hypothetical protein [Thermoanaerobaculia bacterium]